MNRFYGTVDGSAKTTASRRGFNSLQSHTRGYNKGIRIYCEIDENNNDVFTIYETGGSNNPSNTKLITRIIDHNI